MIHLLSKLIPYLLFLLSCSYGFSAEENFLLINGITNETILELGPKIHERFSPCSTFKITLSLMGYDAGILSDENTPTWDYQEGYDDFLESWKSPHTPESWMKNSCIWYSKILAIEIGLNKIQGYLNALEYGNKDMSGGLGQPGPEGVAWINSSLKISLKEQIEFIKKINLGMSPFSPDAIQKTKVIIFKEVSLEGWELYGKTGWCGSHVIEDGKKIEFGWFVGWIEKDTIFFPFAYLIRDQTINLNQRIPRVKQLLTESNATQLTWVEQ